MRVALTGGAYQSRSVIASAQRSLNLYSEPLPQAQGEPMPVAHYPTPGLSLFTTMPQAPVRGIRQASSGGIYVVAGSGVYRINAGGAPPTQLGSITAGLTTPVSMVDNNIDMVIVDGSANGWVVHLATDTMGQIGTSYVSPAAAASTEAIVPSVARYTQWTSPITGEIPAVAVTLGTGFTGNLTCSLFTDGGGVPSDVIGSAATLANPVAGQNILAFGAAIPVTVGTQYWLGFDCDASGGTWSTAAGATGKSSNTVYFYFPQASPATTPAAAVVCEITVSVDPGGMFVGADRADYLDGFFIFNKPGTPQFYWSVEGSVTFDPFAQDTANKGSYSDNLMTVVVAKKEIYLLGERTSEIWYNAAIPDPTTGFILSQFGQVQGTFIDHGCVAKYSAASYDNGVYWLTRDRSGRGIVIQAAGYQTTRISTYAIESAIAGYGVIEDAIGMVYQMAGHVFYVLTFPSADHTWVYDITTRQWHEWLWCDVNGAEHRHRAMCCYPCGPVILVGDWQYGYVYELDRDTYTDNNFPIKRQRAFPHMVLDGRRLFYREFLADMETGTNSPVPNLVSLDWSDDRGHSYGSPVTISLGNGGEYFTSLQWQRLGMTRDRVFRLTWMAETNTALQGAWITVDPADAETAAAANAKGAG